jgi:hypothetical protein
MIRPYTPASECHQRGLAAPTASACVGYPRRCKDLLRAGGSDHGAGRRKGPTPPVRLTFAAY